MLFRSPKDGNFPKLFATVCDQALMEWVRHGKEAFETNKEILNWYLEDYGLSYRYTKEFDIMSALMVATATQP